MMPKFRIDEMIVKFIISPIIGGFLFLILYRVEFRFYNLWAAIGIFFIGVLLVAIANMFAEVINRLYGEVR